MLLLSLQITHAGRKGKYEVNPKDSPKLSRKEKIDKRVEAVLPESSKDPVQLKGFKKTGSTVDLLGAAKPGKKPTITKDPTYVCLEGAKSSSSEEIVPPQGGHRPSVMPTAAIILTRAERGRRFTELPDKPTEVFEDEQGYSRIVGERSPEKESPTRDSKTSRRKSAPYQVPQKVLKIE